MLVLQEVHRKVKSSGEIDFSNAIGGTKKVNPNHRCTPDELPLKYHIYPQD